MTVPLTLRGRCLGARRDRKSPEEEAGAGVETGVETGGGRETGDTGDTRQRAVTPVGIFTMIFLIVSNPPYHCRLQL